MRRIQIIVNNGAGTGRAHRVWNETQCLLRGYKIKYEAHMTRYEGHAAKLAEQISRVKGEEPVYLLVVGGDGTINEVLNGITDFDKVRFGVIPTGSGNDFGRNLKLPKTPKESLREICACIRKDQRGEALYRIDLGQVSWEGCEKPRIFGISSGLGLDALVCKKALHSRLKQVLNRFHLGKLTYLALTVQSLFTMETANAKLYSSEDDLCGSYESAGRRRRGSYGTSCIGAGRSALAWQCIRNRQMADFFPASVSGCCKAGAY